jgi:hypothetical protein
LAIFSILAIWDLCLNIQASSPLPFSLVLSGVANGLYSLLYPWILIRKSWSLTIPVGIAHAVLGAMAARKPSTELP